MRRRDRRPRTASAEAVGLIVEGETEFRALPLLCKIAGCPPLKTINLGGVGADMTSSGVAKLIMNRVKQHLLSGLRRVIVCIDREERDTCPGLLAQEIQRELLRVLGPIPANTSIQVVVADRTFEAWILADASGLHSRRLLVNAPRSHSFEGSMGQRNRKGVEELGRMLGRDYMKTKDGPRLFGQINLAEARRFKAGGRGSRSLDKLLRCLGI